MRGTRTVVVSSSAAEAAPLLFQSLVVTQPGGRAGRRGATLFASAGLHSLFVTAVVVLPLLLAEKLPAKTVGTFFPEPLQIEVQPPPPAPPPGVRGVARRARAAGPATPDFVAPVSPPTGVRVEQNDFGLDEVGDRNGVEGGMLDGVTGSVLADLPPPPPPARPRVVRISTRSAPRLIRRVAPEYPPLAIASRVSAVIVVEAEVDTRGHVQAVRVLRGHPLFDDAAVAAVKQWAYQPLLLNGETTAFILNVTVTFSLR